MTHGGQSSRVALACHHPDRHLAAAAAVVDAFAMSERATDRTADDEQDKAEAALTAHEAATRLGLSERTVRRAIARGELRAVKRAGAFRIAPADLQRFRARRDRAGWWPGVEPSDARSADEPQRREPPQLIPLPGRP